MKQIRKFKLEAKLRQYWAIFLIGLFKYLKRKQFTLSPASVT